MKTTITMAILIILMLFPAWSQQAQQARMYDDRPKITVNGEAVVYVKPDKIVITLGLETWDKDIVAAKEKNNDILKTTMAAAKDVGVAEKDMQTDYLSIEPRWTSNHRREGFIGYFVRNTLVITLTDTKKVEDIITRALLSGVNYIHGVDFQTTEFKKYREQARELALKAAKEKAEKMAAVLGNSIGTAIQINESYAGSPWYYSGWSGWGSARSHGMSQNVMQNVSGGSGDITETVALGKIAIRANVTVTFELKQ